MWRISSAEALPISRPSNLIDPSRITCFFGSNPITERASTVLPDPDSPTTPNVRPRSSEKETSSTACTTPRDVSKCVSTFVTSSNGPSSDSVGKRSVMSARSCRRQRIKSLPPARRSGP